MKFKYYDYHQKVKQVAEEAEKKPKTHKLKTYSIATLGLCIIALLHLGLITLTAGLIYIAFQMQGIPQYIVGLIALITAHSSFKLFRLYSSPGDPLNGIVADPSQFEELTTLVNDLRLELNCPRFTRIILSFDINAAVYQPPSFFFWGVRARCLILGMPLMSLLSSAQLRAVIAHEIAHVTQHSKSLWIKRVQAAWARLISEESKMPLLVRALTRPIGTRYMSMLSAHTSVLSRQQEHEADEISVNATNPEVVGTALRRIAVSASYVEDRLLPSLKQRMISTKSSKSIQFYANMLALAKTPTQHGDFEIYQRKAEIAKAGSFDVHPALRDRLQAIGYDSNRPPSQEALMVTNAAQIYLHKKHNDYSAAYDIQCRTNLSHIWSYTHKTAKIYQKQLTYLTRKYRDIGLKHPHDMYQLANICEYLGKDPLALEYYTEALKQHPNNTTLQFSRARLILHNYILEGEQPDQISIETLKNLMSESLRFKFESMSYLHEYYLKSGNEAEADILYDQILRSIDDAEEQRKAREHLKFSTPLAPHDLRTQDVDSMAIILREYEMIKKVYMVRRSNRAQTGESQYILLYQLKHFHGLDNETIKCLSHDLADRFAFYGDICVGCSQTVAVHIDWKIESAAGKPIYKWKKP